MLSVPQRFGRHAACHGSTALVTPARLAHAGGKSATVPSRRLQELVSFSQSGCPGVCKGSLVCRAAGSASKLAKDDLPNTPPVKHTSMESIADVLDDITDQYKKLDEHFDKEYIKSVVSLRDVLMDYEWRRHGKALAERKGVAKFEQFCAENDVDVSFEAITALYNNPHDLTVLPSTKLKLQARSIIQQIIDERYTSCYAECSGLAKELAKTGLTDMIPDGAEKMAGAVKNMLPLPAFVKKML